MESISINAIIITINRMWNEERDLRPFYSKVPKRKQILSVRNMKKKKCPEYRKPTSEIPKHKSLLYIVYNSVNINNCL